jgi:hypothetical protein
MLKDLTLDSWMDGKISRMVNETPFKVKAA